MSEAKPAAAAAATQQKKVRANALVTAVPSGDMLTLRPLAPAPAPLNGFETFTLTLGGITAPRLAGNTQPRDEPFAWDSREFLRRRAIGQVVQISVFATSPTGGRCFGTATLAGADLALAVVAEGFATVRPGGGGAANEALSAAEAEARAEHRGMHSVDAAAKARAVRPAAAAQADPLKFFEQWHGKECKGVVEAVRTGSVIRVTFLPSFLVAQVTLAGVACPDVRWIPDRRSLEAEPFGLDARRFVESHVLHRDVAVTLKGVDKQGFVGVVVAVGHDVAEELLKLGFARTVSWGGVRETSDYSAKLAAAQKIAADEKAGMWAPGAPEVPSLVASASGGASASASAASDSSHRPDGAVVGKVVDIPSAGVLVVETGEGKQTKRTRMALASIRVPRVTREDHGRSGPRQRGKKHEELTRKQHFDNMLAMRGREVMRIRLIGQTVHCFKRYERPSAAPAAAGGQEELSSFWDVYSGNRTNVALPLVKDGFVEVVQHRPTDPRSSEFDAFCLAEKRAQAKKRGVFADPNSVEIKRVRDICGDIEQSTQFLPFLVHQGEGDISYNAVVEYVFSGTRLKLYIPSQNVMIALCLQHVQPPARNTPASDEAMAFMKSVAHLRDVSCHVVSIDRRGTFIGSVRMAGEKGQDLAVLLVRNGLVRVEEGRRILPPAELREAEAAAKQEKAGNWARWLAEEAELERRSQQQQTQQREVLEVVVSDFSRSTPKTFWIQSIADVDKLGAMTESLSALAETPEQQQAQRMMHTPAVGTAVIAKFSDDAWYRARINAVHGAKEVSVQYIDFGTIERIPLEHVQPLPRGFELSATPALAKRAELAHVILPSADSGLLDDYSTLFQEMADGRRLTASVEWSANGVLHVALACDTTHINVALIREGLARAEKLPAQTQHQTKLHTSLVEAEEKARKGRLGLWRYGDIDEDEDY